MRITKWLSISGSTLLYASTITAQTAPTWTLQLPQSYPPQRENHGLAFDSVHSQIALFGGDNGGSPLSVFNDTWVWDGSNWTEKISPTGPSARFNLAMAYDAAQAQVVLFGGADQNLNSLNDTWVWDGSNWTQEFPQTLPPVRHYHAMAYDSAHQQVVMFGGEIIVDSDGNLTLGWYPDTWVWDGSNWTRKSPQTFPQRRSRHAMTYDSAHQQVVLFGGNNGWPPPNSTWFNDTWVWDGSNWTQKFPQTSPPPRNQPAMAYDPVHCQVVLFGGFDMNGRLADTWVWDGSNWTEEFPQDSPSARDGHAVVYDSSHSQVVLFGGESPAGVNADTWTWNAGAVANTPTITSVVSASAFGGFTSVAPGSWVEIYGLNLAPDTREWDGTDFTGNNAPTSLDGVEVAIGGQKAFIDYISSAANGQINAQLPSNIATGGPLQLTVSNGATTSAPYNIMVNATEAGLLAPTTFQLGGNQHVVAQHKDGSYVLPAGAIAGVNSTPAQPGETVLIYGVGFGPVTPNIPAGEIVTEDNQLSLPFQMMFGQTLAQLKYDGLAPNYVGLYQFDVVVPSVPDNDLVPLTFTLGGAAGMQKLFTTVRQ